MSYEIFYDRRFITVGNDMYIPIFQHGSNNCWEINYWSGRDVLEKNWSVINYPFKDRYIFSKEEITKMGERVAEVDGMHKSRYKSMTKDEIKKYYINGYKNSKTLEFYLELGNGFELRDMTDWKNPIRYNPKTTEELIELINTLSSEGKPLNMGFTNRDFKAPKRNNGVKKKKEKVLQDFYFVLGTENGEYLYKMKRNGYSYVCFKGSAKAFSSELEATKYLEKYKDKLNGRLGEFSIIKVNEPYTFFM